MVVFVLVLEFELVLVFMRHALFGRRFFMFRRVVLVFTRLALFGRFFMFRRLRSLVSFLLR